MYNYYYMDKQYEPQWSNYLNQFDISNNYFNKISLDTGKFCVIVEPRIHANLILVIKNFLYLLQTKNWGLIIFHSSKNINYLKTKLDGISNIIFINVTEDNLNVMQYNQLLFSTQFWNILKSYKCKHALIFQTDTLLLNDNIDDFINYDYIGAPWSKQLEWKKDIFSNINIGNGGLSLRNVDKMIKILETYPNNIMMRFNEDAYFSYFCLKEKYNIPSIEVAMKFSVETIYYENPCGVHKPLLYMFPNRESYIKLLSKRFNIQHSHEY